MLVLVVKQNQGAMGQDAHYAAETTILGKTPIGILPILWAYAQIAYVQDARRHLAQHGHIPQGILPRIGDKTPMF